MFVKSVLFFPIKDGLSSLAPHQKYLIKTNLAETQSFVYTVYICNRLIVYLSLLLYKAFLCWILRLSPIAKASYRLLCLIRSTLLVFPEEMGLTLHYVWSLWLLYLEIFRNQEKHWTRLLSRPVCLLMLRVLKNVHLRRTQALLAFHLCFWDV